MVGPVGEDLLGLGEGHVIDDREGIAAAGGERGVDRR